MNTQENKALIARYNAEVIEGGNMETFQAIASPNFINHSAGEGMPAGQDGMIYFFSQLLHPAFPDLKVEVLDMIAEGNKVATRKKITASHQGELMGIPPTGKQVEINILDVFTIENGLLREHWGENNFSQVVQSLAN
jgi:steroid delta-isomerase-like uncharacterized protein